MAITTPLALFLANKPGTLAAVCDALAAEKINIFGLTISDTVDHAVVRMVVSDHKKALSIFEEHGTLVLENYPRSRKSSPQRKSTSSTLTWRLHPTPKKGFLSSGRTT